MSSKNAQSPHDRSNRAGSNMMELLMFSLGTREVFGINVFKVKEVCDPLPITRTPNRPHGVEGIISLRGTLMPVLDLATCMNFHTSEPRTKLIITEFSGQSQAFQIHNVDRIVRVDWEHVKSPQSLSTHQESLITALTLLDDGRLVSIIDVEQVLANVYGEVPVPTMDRVQTDRINNVFFADDSAMARRKISEVLDNLGLPHQSAQNGREAWEKLQSAAARAEVEHHKVNEQIGMILVDAEMPEMDGYVLTRNIKDDPRFKGVPVVMHSSLSAAANKKRGEQVGVDAYIEKFHPDELAATVTSMMHVPAPDTADTP